MVAARIENTQKHERATAEKAQACENGPRADCSAGLAHQTDQLLAVGDRDYNREKKTLKFYQRNKQILSTAPISALKTGEE